MSKLTLKMRNGKIEMHPENSRGTILIPHDDPSYLGSMIIEFLKDEETINTSARVIQLTEGQISKGGQNPPNLSTARPASPKGSGGAVFEYLPDQKQFWDDNWED